MCGGFFSPREGAARGGPGMPCSPGVGRRTSHRQCVRRSHVTTSGNDTSLKTSREATHAPLASSIVTRPHGSAYPRSSPALAP